MSDKRRVRMLAPWIMALGGVWFLAHLGSAQLPMINPIPKTDGSGPGKDPEAVLKGLEKVVSTSDGMPSMFTLYIDKKKAEVLAELPKDSERKKYFIALTVAGGETY